MHSRSFTVLYRAAYSRAQCLYKLSFSSKYRYLGPVHIVHALGCFLCEYLELGSLTIFPRSNTI